ncbi:MAG: virulence protein SciE type [Burkholderiaceae bacterium]|jgi:type VI secretion system protein ImpE|nr:virulence protein SciE type [Burkholderiaceae bacterium]
MDATPQSSLDGEIAFIQQKIRSEPTVPKWRMGLFQRYCQAGRWQKALEQLQAYARMFPQGEAFAYAYRVALQQEQVRERVFRGELDPPLPEDAQEWLQVLASTLKRESAGSLTASDLREQALQIAPTSSGTLDDRPFEWIADADLRLGPVCEAIFDGQYQWIPYNRIESIRIVAPSSVCDLVWLSAGIKFWGVESRPALIPARYPLIEGLTDAHLRSALTTWEDQGNDVWIGRGVRILTTNDEEKSLLDVRRIDFNPPA